MRLVIAEKPSVAKAIAGVVGGAEAERRDGYIECASGLVVSWCVGHLLEQKAPESYVASGKVTVADLPVVPKDWLLEPRDPRAGKQFKVLRDLIKRASEVIHAGDADREGQLLVEEVLIEAGWCGNTLRLWLSSRSQAGDRGIRRA